MKHPNIDKADYKSLSELICDHMMSEHELYIGQFEAEALLDKMLKIITPAIYNIAIDDAIHSVRAIGEKMEEELDLRKII